MYMLLYLSSNIKLSFHSYPEVPCPMPLQCRTICYATDKCALLPVIPHHQDLFPQQPDVLARILGDADHAVTIRRLCLNGIAYFKSPRPQLALYHIALPHTLLRRHRQTLAEPALALHREVLLVQAPGWVVKLRDHYKFICEITFIFFYKKIKQLFLRSFIPQ